MNLRLNVPRNFDAFPYLPYEIQLQLMQHLYNAIESSKVTIVESPTGTVSIPRTQTFQLKLIISQGKTLSLLCGSLTWLRDEQERVRRGKVAYREECMSSAGEHIRFQSRKLVFLKRSRRLGACPKHREETQAFRS